MRRRSEGVPEASKKLAGGARSVATGPPDQHRHQAWCPGARAARPQVPDERVASFHPFQPVNPTATCGRAARAPGRAAASLEGRKPGGPVNLETAGEANHERHERHENKGPNRGWPAAGYLTHPMTTPDSASHFSFRALRVFRGSNCFFQDERGCAAEPSGVGGVAQFSRPAGAQRSVKWLIRWFRCASAPANILRASGTRPLELNYSVRATGARPSGRRDVHSQRPLRIIRTSAINHCLMSRKRPFGKFAHPVQGARFCGLKAALRLHSYGVD